MPVWKLFLSQFTHFLVAMLIASSIVSLSLGHFVEGVAILTTVILNAIVATYTENSSANALAALADLSQPLANVIRDGQVVAVHSADIVPGDVVVLRTGDVVPADIRLLSSSDLKTNEMLLTGESEEVAKSANPSQNAIAKALTPPNLCFSSTSIAAGHARGLVVEIGMRTRVGQIAQLLRGGGGGGAKPAGGAGGQGDEGKPGEVAAGCSSTCCGSKPKDGRIGAAAPTMTQMQRVSLGVWSLLQWGCGVFDISNTCAFTWVNE